jgi:hypothetical protein
LFFFSNILLIVFSIVFLILFLFNSRISILIIDIYKNTTYTLILQIPNNTNNNINLFFVFILDIAAFIGDNIICLLLYQNFIIISCESNSVTKTFEIYNVAVERGYGTWFADT